MMMFLVLIISIVMGGGYNNSVTNASSAIRNVNVERSSDLMDAGSNLVIFKTSIEMAIESYTPYYYYTVAKDYEWSFIALEITTEDPKDQASTLTLGYEKVDDLPEEFQNIGAGRDNILIYKISLANF